MKQAPQSVTLLPENPDAERRTRMIKYTIAMTVRVICIVLMLFVQGWWLLIFAAGAIFLPYFAVIIANVKSPPKPLASVNRPGTLQRIFRNHPNDSR